MKNENSWGPWFTAAVHASLALGLVLAHLVVARHGAPLSQIASLENPPYYSAIVVFLAPIMLLLASRQWWRNRERRASN